MNHWRETVSSDFLQRQKPDSSTPNVIYSQLEPETPSPILQPQVTQSQSHHAKIKQRTDDKKQGEWEIMYVKP